MSDLDQIEKITIENINIKDAKKIETTLSRIDKAILENNNDHALFLIGQLNESLMLDLYKRIREYISASNSVDKKIREYFKDEKLGFALIIRALNKSKVFTTSFQKELFSPTIDSVFKRIITSKVEDIDYIRQARNKHFHVGPGYSRIMSEKITGDVLSRCNIYIRSLFEDFYQIGSKEGSKGTSESFKIVPVLGPYYEAKALSNNLDFLKELTLHLKRMFEKNGFSGRIGEFNFAISSIPFVLTEEFFCKLDAIDLEQDSILFQISHLGVALSSLLSYAIGPTSTQRPIIGSSEVYYSMSILNNDTNGIIHSLLSDIALTIYNLSNLYSNEGSNNIVEKLWLLTKLVFNRSPDYCRVFNSSGAFRDFWDNTSTTSILGGPINFTRVVNISQAFINWIVGLLWFTIRPKLGKLKISVTPEDLAFYCCLHTENVYPILYSMSTITSAITPKRLLKFIRTVYDKHENNEYLSMYYEKILSYVRLGPNKEQEHSCLGFAPSIEDIYPENQKFPIIICTEFSNSIEHYLKRKKETYWVIFPIENVGTQVACRWILQRAYYQEKNEDYSFDHFDIQDSSGKSHFEQACELDNAILLKLNGSPLTKIEPEVDRILAAPSASDIQHKLLLPRYSGYNDQTGISRLPISISSKLSIVLRGENANLFYVGCSASNPDYFIAIHSTSLKGPLGGIFLNKYVDGVHEKSIESLGIRVDKTQNITSFLKELGGH